MCIPATWLYCSYKNFADYQASFFNIIRDVVQIACAVRRQVDPNILPSREIYIHGQDITERDNPNLSIAFQRATLAASELYDRKMIDTRALLRIVYQFGGLTYDETDDQPEGLRRPIASHRRHESPVSPSPKTDP